MSWKFILICFFVLVVGFTGLQILDQRINKVNEHFKSNEIQLFSKQLERNITNYIDNVKINFSLIIGINKNHITKEWFSDIYLNYSELFPALESMYYVNKDKIKYSFYKNYKHNLIELNYDQYTKINSYLEDALYSDTIIVSKPINFYNDENNYVLFFIPINKNNVLLVLFNLNLIIDQNLGELIKPEELELNIKSSSNELLYGKEFPVIKEGDILIYNITSPMGEWSIKFWTKNTIQYIFLRKMISIMGYALMALLAFYMLIMYKKNKTLVQNYDDLKTAEHKLTLQFEREQLLRRIIQNIHSQRNIDELLNYICSELGNFYQVDYTGLLTNSEQIAFKYEYNNKTVKKSLIGKALDKNAELYQKLITEKEIILSSDIKNDKRLIIKDLMPYIKLLDMKSFVLLPVVYKDDVLALFLFAQIQQKRNWQTEEIEYIKTAMSQIAIALYQSNLIEELTSTSQVILETFNQEQCIKNVSRVIRTSIDIKEIVYFTCKELIKLLNIDLAYFAEYDNELNEIVSIRGIIKENNNITMVEENEFLRGQLNKILLKLPEKIFIEQAYYDDANQFFLQLFKLPMAALLTSEFFMKSFVTTPITFQNKIFGYLVTINIKEHRKWESLDLDFLRKVAEQIAIGSYQIKLYEELKTFTDKQVIINKIFEVIRSSIDIDDILSNACNEIGNFLQVDRCFILEHNYNINQSEPIRYEYRSKRDMEDLIGKQARINPDNYFAFNCVINNKTPFVADTIDKHSAFIEFNGVKNFIENYEIKSLLMIPIIYMDDVFATICLCQSETDRRWIGSEIYFLNSIANQVAIGIHQANLFKELDIANKKLMNSYIKEQTIRKILEVVRTSLDLKKIYKDITEEIAKTFKVNRCYFAEYDPKKDTILFPQVEYRSDDSIESVLDKKIPDSMMKLILNVAKRHTPYIIDGYEKSPLTDEDKELLKSIGVKSAIILPIFHQNQSQGIFVVSQTDYQRSWTSDDIEVLRIVADQVGIAITQAKMYESIQEMSRLKSEFLASVSHELKTPLNSILVLSELMQNKDTIKSTEEQVELLQIIHNSGEELLKHINNILDMAKMEFVRKEPNLQSFCLSELVEEITNIIKAIAEEKNIQLNINIDNTVNEFIVSDRELMKFILNNLLNNAIKFTEAGVIDLTINQISPAGLHTMNLDIDEQLKPGSQYLILKVEDTGIGIDKEYHKLIFEDFRQVEDAEVRKYGGTGLGLAICKKSVNILGGTIILESQKGKGSKFSVIIPI